ncbi:hypothetical protein [Neobacillus sp. LXY-4]|uniref:hypothetical protein n=1 Tax=Neobacillus sp. LXY-4 TaxID=3379826 RepID=UPI003EE4215E
MLEYILDFTDLYAVYSIYAGFVLGLLLKLFIVWSLKEANFELITKKIEFSLTINDFQIQKKSRIVPNHILVWIIKFIRNKTGTGDDKEASMIILHP